MTVNPCIDKTVTVEKFEIDNMNRVRVVRTDFAGKGINVSAALKNLHVQTFCLGLNFPDGFEIQEKQLNGQGIPHHFIEVPGKLRFCTKIFDLSRKHTIEINEYGSEVAPEYGERLTAYAAETAKKCSFITLSGSIPPGLSEDYYLKCAAAIRQAAPNCRIVVDAEKRLLLKALEHPLCFIKPNIHEFQETFGCTVKSMDELDRAARNVLDRYELELICVSLGGDGAYIADRKAAYCCRSPRVEVRSIQGAGDSVVAGMCMALEQDLPLEEVLHYGVAAAGASISREGTQLCTREGFQECLKQDIGIKRIR
ncbi:MAG: 1-phosphofructokinase family hexose kinase [Lentisphaeria bacterium]|nr:1-phosphofructokinase family hexose kinase [Lentisphaeria bacterium]